MKRQSWEKVPLAGGVVKTRGSGNLRPGECTQASNVRLVPGDPDRIHRDWKYDVLLEDDQFFWRYGSIRVMEYIKFEGKDPLLIVVTEEDQSGEGVAPTTCRIIYIKGDGSGQEVVETFLHFGEDALEGDVTHRGNEYFLGTSAGNYVLSDGSPVSVREMGMIRAAGEVNPIPVFSIPNVGSGQDFEAVWVNYYAVFVYWFTEYDETNDIESGASDPALFLGPAPISYFKVKEAVYEKEIYRDIGDFPVVGQVRQYTTVVQEPAIQAADQHLPPEDFDQFYTTLRIKPQVKNPNTTHIRIYRSFIGLAKTRLDQQAENYEEGVIPSDPSIWIPDTNSPEYQDGTQVVENNGPLVGGMVDEVAVTSFSTILDYQDNWGKNGLSDPAVKYPLLSIGERGGFQFYDYLRRPPAFVSAEYFQQSLVKVPAANRQVIEVSPVENPEYQQVPLSIPVISDRDDEIKDLKTIRNLCLIFTTTGVMRLNFIPFDGITVRDNIVESVVRLHGVTNRRHVAVADTVRGPLAVWLSRHHLFATDGQGWDNICPDFSVESTLEDGVDLSKCRLVSSPRNYRLELWAPRGTGFERWDFIYDRDHLKGGKFKMMGPTSMLLVSQVWVAQGPDGDNERVWVLVENPHGGDDIQQANLLMEGDQYAEAEAEVRLGRSWGSNPASMVQVNALGIQHDRSPEQVIRVGVEAVLQNGGVREDINRLPLDLETGFTFQTLKEGSGSYVAPVVKWVAESDANLALGPLWTRVRETGGGSGG